MELHITVTGTIRCLYDDALPLHGLGPLQITRASHIEPDAQGQWWADLSPVPGPRLGPFARRNAALTAEVDWLRDHHLPGPPAV
jgi:hypothetical protein